MRRKKITEVDEEEEDTDVRIKEVDEEEENINVRITESQEGGPEDSNFTFRTPTK